MSKQKVTRVEKVEINEYWFEDENGEKHRDDDEPAYVGPRIKIWYKHGKIHRDNGYAIVKKQFLNSCVEFTSYYWMKQGKYCRENDLPTEEHSDGSQFWINGDGQKHRDNDLPAVIRENGDKEWYQHGNLHRDNDLPAIEQKDGSKIWYRHGQLHREGDKPAAQYANGGKLWYINGVYQKSNHTRANIVDATAVSIEKFIIKGLAKAKKFFNDNPSETSFCMSTVQIVDDNDAYSLDPKKWNDVISKYVQTPWKSSVTGTKWTIFLES